MRKSAFLLILASVFFVSAARAEWRLVWQDGFSRIYLDPASRERTDGGAIFVRALTDYDPHSPQAVDFKLPEKGLSEIETASFDCAKSAYRSGGGSWFSGRMATGEMRSAYPAKETWSKIPPFYQALAREICAAP
ncbi:surface-adhesin E family protein [Methylocystis parvus]|uniref:Surface-adhesin protein E-like domain-containing protein n=1 Tax=Methylocystis parvus TaxID=134 RepID=A0A6B8M7W6_9HYPH|nr:surface-adhesin E family protein [Methylocystis parvus]QGM96830.1 hypothetical protein F7D14_04620 [Methylocystis parvus]WBJ99292.1 hypothetical protein MMG94_15005 [Methylocystis parvus OBBP]